MNTENVNYDVYVNGSCWNRSVYLEIEDTLSRQWFESESASWNALNAGSYGGSDSVSWIISVFQALAASLILWQPLTIAFATWIKLWMFTWNLRMDIGPSNLMALYKRCCGHDPPIEELSCESPSESTTKRPRKSRKRQTRTEKELDGAVRRLTKIMNRISESHTEPMTSWTEHRSGVMQNQHRPLDVMSFLTNQQWIIDDMTRDIHLERYSDAKLKQEDLMKDHEYFESENVEYEIKFDEVKRTSSIQPAMETVAEESPSEMAEKRASRPESLGTVSALVSKYNAIDLSVRNDQVQADAR